MKIIVSGLNVSLRLRYTILRVCFLMLFINSAKAQFVNGDFSLGGNGCVAPTGWTTGTGSQSAERTSAMIGGFWIDLTSCNTLWGNGAWIQQAVATTPGACYYVEFDLGSVCGWDAADAGVYFSVDGTPVGTRIVQDSFDCSPSTIYYKRVRTPVFTATANTTALRFTGEGRCSYISLLWNTCGPIGNLGNPGVIAVDNFVLVPAGVSGGSLSLGNDTTFCNQFSHVLDAGSGMTTYEWNTGEVTQTITVTTPGAYWCRVTSICSIAADTINIFQSSVPQVNLGSDISGCVGDILQLSGNGLYTSPSYLWNTGAVTPTISVTQSGTYTLTVDDNGCIASDTIEVTIYPYPEVDLGNDTGLCQSELPVMLRSVQPPGSRYLWSNGLSTTELAATRGGTYWLEVHLGGCVSSDTIVISVTPDPFVYIGSDTVICEQFPLRIGTELAGAAYLWNTGATTPYINVRTTDAFYLAVDIDGCTVYDTVQIIAMPVPDVDLGGNRDICPDQTIILDGSYGTGSRYVWTTGETGSSIAVTDAGTYGVQVVTEHQCVGGDSVMLNYYPRPVVSLGKDTAVCEETPLLLRPAMINADSVRWSDGTVGDGLYVTYGGVYVATGINKCGTGADTIEVRQIFCDIWVPNVFTPNGDGKNDVFRALGNLGRTEAFGLSIYNRWGERIFHTRDKYKGWDGSYNGGEALLGTYLYLLEYSFEGKPYQLKGSFHLLR